MSNIAYRTPFFPSYRQENRPISMLFTLVLGLMPYSVFSSSPGEWEKLYQRAETSCLKKSELKTVSVASAPIIFDDHIALLLKGRWPQAHMKNQTATFLCLYHKQSGNTQEREVIDPARTQPH